jgi:hypothetical protein
MAKKKKLSKNEKAAAKAGVSTKEYKASKKSKSKKSSKKSSSSSVKDLVNKSIKSILNVTPAFQKTAADFESTVYTPEIAAEDEVQAKALFEPYFNEQINTLLEDLNVVEQMESVSYDRSLRRARSSMAQAGGAIGTQREENDKMITDDYQYNRNNRLRTSERTIGTERMQGAGYQPVAGTPQEGSLIREMKGTIADQILWNKNQRAQRYYGDVGNYYSQSPGVSLTGKTL